MRKLPDLRKKSIGETRDLKRQSAVSDHRSPGVQRSSGMDGRTARALSGSEMAAVWIDMAEASNYYVTVSVDHRIIPGRVMIRAASKDVAAQKAEMKVALQIRDAITVKAIDVREG